MNVYLLIKINQINIKQQLKSGTRTTKKNYKQARGWRFVN